jgi:hypothetical protein
VTDLARRNGPKRAGGQPYKRRSPCWPPLLRAISETPQRRSQLLLSIHLPGRGIRWEMRP